MERFGTEVLQPDALPGVNHMRAMQYQIVLNPTFESKTQLILKKKKNVCIQFVCKIHIHKTAILMYTQNYPLVASYDIPG